MYTFHEKHCDKPKTFIVSHFKAEGVPRSTLFEILKRKEDGVSSERGVLNPLKSWQKWTVAEKAEIQPIRRNIMKIKILFGFLTMSLITL